MLRSAEVQPLFRDLCDDLSNGEWDHESIDIDLVVSTHPTVSVVANPPPSCYLCKQKITPLDSDSVTFNIISIKYKVHHNLNCMLNVNGCQEKQHNCPIYI